MTNQKADFVAATLLGLVCCVTLAFAQDGDSGIRLAPAITAAELVAPLEALVGIDTVRAIVGNGLNDMPPFAAALTAQQIVDVSAWVVEEFPAAQ